MNLINCIKIISGIQANCVIELAIPFLTFMTINFKSLHRNTIKLASISQLASIITDYEHAHS